METTNTATTNISLETTKENKSETKKEVIREQASQGSMSNIRSFTKLYFSYYVRTFDAIFLTFIFPLLMLFMLGAVMPAQTLLPGLWLLPGITTAFFFLPKSLVHWRSSSLIKRIGITPIKPWEFIASILLVNIAVATVGFFMMMGVTAIINATVPFFIQYSESAGAMGEMTKNAFIWGDIDWIHLILGFYNVMFLALATALAVGMFATSEGQAFGIGMTLYFVISFLGGVFFDVILINSIMPLQYTAMGLPWAWTMNLFIAAASEGTEFWVLIDAADSGLEYPGGGSWPDGAMVKDAQTIYDILGVTKEGLWSMGYSIGLSLSALFLGLTAKFTSFGKIK